MFPPPTTTAIWTPRSTTSASCRPTSAVASVLIPDPSGDANASPESLRRTRWYSALPALPVTFALAPSVIPSTRTSTVRGLTQLVSDEPADSNLLSDLRTHLVEELLDRLRVVLHERLFQQDGVLVERLQLPFDDPVDHVVRLPGFLGLHPGDVLLLCDDVGGNLLTREPSGCRRAGDVQRDV